MRSFPSLKTLYELLQYSLENISMAFLKMLITALGQALMLSASHQAQLFVEAHFRQLGHDEESIHTAREAVNLLVITIISGMISQILRILICQ